jgi:hypothetical protein
MPSVYFISRSQSYLQEPPPRFGPSLSGTGPQIRGETSSYIAPPYFVDLDGSFLGKVLSKSSSHTLGSLLQYSIVAFWVQRLKMWMGKIKPTLKKILKNQKLKCAARATHCCNPSSKVSWPECPICLRCRGRRVGDQRLDKLQGCRVSLSKRGNNVALDCDSF